MAAIILLGAAACTEVFGQMYPERKYIRKGNRDYEKLDFGASEGDYRTAVSKHPLSYEGNFNLGGAIYKQERYEEAENTYKSILENPTLTDEKRAKVFYNLGNTYFAQQKLQEAANSYVSSLIHNPDDMETKYNLAYVLELLKNQPQGGGDGDGENDQDQNHDNQDKDQKDNQDGQGDDKQDNKEGKDDQTQNGDRDNKDGKTDQDRKDEKENGENDSDANGNKEKPDPSRQEGAGAKISRADAEKMLEAIQAEEDKAREKANEKNASGVGKSGKNW